MGETLKTNTDIYYELKARIVTLEAEVDRLKAMERLFKSRLQDFADAEAQRDSLVVLVRAMLESSFAEATMQSDWRKSVGAALKGIENG